VTDAMHQSGSAKECGLPEGAGSVFVQDGTLGNLSALVAAREKVKHELGDQKWAVICSSEAHSSVKSVANVMDVAVFKGDTSGTGSMGKEAAAKAIEEAKAAGFTPFAIVGTAGTTNFGINYHPHRGWFEVAPLGSDFLPRVYLTHRRERLFKKSPIMRGVAPKDESLQSELSPRYIC
jgi:hypothetical protein